MYEQQSLLTADLDEIIDATGHNDAQPQEQAQKAPAVKYYPIDEETARRAELSDSQFTAIRSAHNLFNGGSSSSVTPYDLALCDYLTLDIITQAMYIWKCGCTIFAGQDGSIQLDRTGECQRRGIEQALFQHLSEFE